MWLCLLRPEQRKLQLIRGDVMKTELPFFDICISNTPYQVITIVNNIVYSLYF
jgi:16S rRNA A1518/A1519 N6-dimethyltransferase RsmA/KsgA/DIM1 with predicted DNA glycosylase/AP lyase activity